MSNDSQMSSIYFAQQRELRRKVASLEKAIDRNEDRITKLRKLSLEQIQSLGARVRHLLNCVKQLENHVLPAIDDLPFGDIEELEKE